MLIAAHSVVHFVAATMMAWAVLQATSQDLPREISFYVTVRDFIANPCRAVGGGPNLVYCPEGLASQVTSGQISGHIDFQRVTAPVPYTSRNNVVGAYLSKYAQFGRRFPVVKSGGTTEASDRTRPFVLSDLAYDTAGIPKMQFCGSENAEGYLCDYNDTRGRSVGDAASFSTWHQDSALYNRRSGYKQTFFLRSNNIYEFNSANVTQDPRSPNFFNPVGDNNLTNAWPLSQAEVDEDYTQTRSFKYWFTSEIHSSFQYHGGELINFSGDDDVHVFINNRLALNLGGVHASEALALNLTLYERELGLDRNGTYQFDLFHAERQVSASNFGLQTTLSPACNVLSMDLRTNGRDVAMPIDWRAQGGVTNNSDWVFISDPELNMVDPDTRVARLMNPGVPDSVSYMFYKDQVNLGDGFSLSFRFQASGTGHGFAIVMHNRQLGLTDLVNSGSGPNLGINTLDNSIAIVFDACPGFPTSCGGNSSQLRMHYNKTGAGRNSALLASTRAVHDLNVLQNWYDGEEHTVEVFYYAVPDWFEVYVDNSLRLVQRGLSPRAVFGGHSHAYVGFSSSSSVSGNSMDVRISDVTMKTVRAIPSLTYLSDNPREFPKVFVANSSVGVAFRIQTRDGCERDLSFGGLSTQLHAQLIATAVPNEPPSNGSVLAELGTALLPQEVLDTQDGSYEIRFTSDVVATFTLHVAFGGESCSWTGIAYDSSTCDFTAVYPNATTNVPNMSTLSPTAMPSNTTTSHAPTMMTASPTTSSPASSTNTAITMSIEPGIKLISWALTVAVGFSMTFI